MPPNTARKTSAVSVDNLEQAYFGHALDALGKVNQDAQFVQFSDDDDAPISPHIPVKTVRRRASLLEAARSGAPSLEQALVEYQADVLLTRIDAAPVRTNVPKVLFAMDMTFHDQTPKGPGAPLPPMARKIKRICMDAKIILCPSDYVHKTCAAQLEMGLEKAIVARPGVDDVFAREQASIVAGRYALFLLNRYSFGSIETLMQAIRRNPDLFPPNLVVLGRIHPGEPVDWARPVVRVEQCPDEMTASLMRHAEVVLYPARGDGSGMPVLQAMRAGARIVTSKSGALFELAGAAPLYCEPDNAISLLQVLRRMFDESPSEQEKRRQMARSLVFDCTWERCGKKILSALKRGLL